MTGHNILRSTAVVSACTMLSRVLGMVRLILMASLFGTSLVQSAFVLAFRIPNLFRRLFGEGALSAAFVPVFTETLEREGIESASRLAGRVMSLLGATLFMLVLGGILLATALLRFPALDERTLAVLPLLRIMLPYMFFICLVAACMAILNSFHHFAVPAATPVLLNVVWILTLLFICPRFGDLPKQRIYGAAWGILAAGCIQLLVQVPALRRFGIRLPFSLDFRNEKVRMILGQMAPAALGIGVIQINVMIDSVLAMIVGGWAPAALNYAEIVVYLPLGVFATALGTVLLPTFSRLAAQARPADMKHTLNEALRIMFYVMIPATVGLVVISRPIVQLLYEWPGREFDAESTVQTARALLFYAPGLIVFGFYKVLVPVFYALKDTRTPVRIAARVVALNFVLNVLFVLTWPAGFKHAGLACATVLASAVNGGVLAVLLHRRLGSPGWVAVFRGALRALLLAALMGCTVAAAHQLLASAVALSGVAPKIGQLLTVLGAILAGLVVYLGLLGTWRRAELLDLAQSGR